MSEYGGLNFANFEKLIQKRLHYAEPERKYKLTTSSDRDSSSLHHVFEADDYGLTDTQKIVVIEWFRTHPADLQEFFDSRDSTDVLHKILHVQKSTKRSDWPTIPKKKQEPSPSPPH